jgi:hypothetical protein
LAVLAVAVPALALLPLAGCGGEPAGPPAGTAGPTPAGGARPSPTAGGATPGGTTGTPAAAIDPCLVGMWIEVSYESVVDLSGLDLPPARVRGAGRTLTFRADGTELVDYGTGVTYRDGAFEETASGRTEFRVTTRAGQLSFQPLVDGTRFEYRYDGAVVGSTEGNWAPADVVYTCSGDTMTQAIDDSYAAEYRRG